MIVICYKMKGFIMSKVKEHGLKRFFPKLFPKNGANIHLVWHDFYSNFMISDISWKFKGIKMIRKVEVWAKKWKNDVKIIKCDDALYTSSILVLIKHRGLKTGKYHGTSIIFIPQCTGENPTVFFLYPRNHDNLISVLSKIKAKHIKQWDDI